MFVCERFYYVPVHQQLIEAFFFKYYDSCAANTDFLPSVNSRLVAASAFFVTAGLLLSIARCVFDAAAASGTDVSE